MEREWQVAHLGVLGVVINGRQFVRGGLWATNGWSGHHITKSSSSESSTGSNCTKIVTIIMIRWICILEHGVKCKKKQKQLSIIILFALHVHKTFILTNEKVFGNRLKNRQY